MKKPAEPDLTKLVEAACREVAETVIKRTKQCGTPVIVWENGKIKRLDPHKIRLPRRRKNKD